MEDNFPSVKIRAPLLRWWSRIRRLLTSPGFCLKSMINRVQGVPCVPAWSTCQKRVNFSYLRANVPMNVPTCERAKGMPIIQLGLPACQRRANFLTWRANLSKGVSIFQLFFKRNFNFWISQLCLTFTNFNNIWAILPSLSRETKKINFDTCKISLRKNLINLKALTSFSMEYVGLTEQIFG